MSFKGLIFIEKPTHFPPGAHVRENVYVGYDLRFSPVLNYVHQNLESLGNIYYVNAYCGQHLSQWRDRDYKESYSSSVRSGGGVVNDSTRGPYAAWCWKANGGTATATISESGNNPAAVVQANQLASPFRQLKPAVFSFFQTGGYFI